MMFIWRKLPAGTQKILAWRPYDRPLAGFIPAVVGRGWKGGGRNGKGEEEQKEGKGEESWNRAAD